MNSKRLLILANHLINEPLLLNSWNFGRFYLELPNTCKTVGCAIGECALLFGDEKLLSILKEYNRTWQYHLDILNMDKIRNWALDFFNITDKQYTYLFLPYDGYIDEISYLTEKASKRQVGLFIKDFVENEGKITHTRTKEDSKRMYECEELENDI